jgi:predicted dehydrogenase
MSEKTKIGIIGCGQICRAYLEGLKQFNNIEVCLCADVIPEAAQKYAEEYGIKAVSVEQLLAAPEIEIVINLTHPQVHREVSLQILNAGKHCYSEKPISIDLKSAAEIMETAKNKNLRVGCAPDTFLGGGHQTVRKLIDDGWIGRPIAGKVMFMSPGPRGVLRPANFYKTGAGPMFDMGPYYMTALVNLLGPAKRVSAITSKAFDYRIANSRALKPGEKFAVEVPTHYSGSIEFCNGTVITAIISFDVAVCKHQHLVPIEIFGTKGSILAPDPNGFGGPVELASAYTEQPEWTSCQAANSYITNSRGIGVADMAEAIKDNRPHRASGELAYHVLEIMEAFEKSSNSGNAIELLSSCIKPEAMPFGALEGRLS